MSITPWMVYWLTRLDGFIDLLQGTGASLIIISIFLVLVWGMVAEFETRYFRKTYLFIPAIGALCVLFSYLLPTEKDMAAILVIPRIVNNQQVQAIPSKILDLATEWLDALKPKASK